jgi:hypothetical protein
VLLALALLIVAGLSLAWQRKLAAEPRPFPLVVGAAFAQLLLVPVVFALQVSEENRYLLPLAPALAICFLWVFSLGGSTVLKAATGLMAVQLILVHAQALGLTKTNFNVSYWLVPDHWLVPDQPDRVALAELHDLVRLTSGPGTEFRYNVVGVQFPWLNENALAFYAAQGRLSTGRRNYFTSLGYAETDADRAWTRMEQMKTLYYVGVEPDREPAPPDFLNQVSVPILRRVMADPNYTRVPFASQLGIVLFRRGDTPAQ